MLIDYFFCSSRRRHTRCLSDWSSDVCSSDLRKMLAASMVQGGLSVAPVTNSSLVRISFDSSSPAWAQRIANGAADSYVSSNRSEERRVGNGWRSQWVRERLRRSTTEV